MNILTLALIVVAVFFGIYFIGYKDGKVSIIFNLFTKAGKWIYNKVYDLVIKEDNGGEKVEKKKVKKVEKVEKKEVQETEDDIFDLPIFDEPDW